MDQAASEIQGQQALIRTLRDTQRFGQACDDFDVVETHISWVILCGSYAYKIKKAVDLGFLDFSTLDKRRFYCEEEIRLNGRLAPELYLDVAPITGRAEAPVLDGEGPAIEYAVRMRRFPQDSLLNRRLTAGKLGATEVEAMVEVIADFHHRIPAAAPLSDYGSPERVLQPVVENFQQIGERVHDARHTAMLARLHAWSGAEHQHRFDDFLDRKRRGCIRECHGDMHLGNMAWIDGRLLIFDGIEFNPNLYWIDCMSEVAFLCMDLEDHGRRDLAYRFLNGYLERTGDYEGLSVLRYYQVYRAMVRAKVAAIRMTQNGSEGAEEFENYLQLALGYTQPPPARLFLTHGLSGSGKSTLTGPLCEALPAVRVRSDRERQRLFGGGEGPVAPDSGIYTPEATDRTYARLLNLSRVMLNAGHAVIVDATFRTAQQREPFLQMAKEVDVPIHILDFQARPDTLRSRVAARSEAGTDVSEADLRVLEHQLATQQPLNAAERSRTIVIDTDKVSSSAQMLDLIGGSG